MGITRGTVDIPDAPTGRLLLDTGDWIEPEEIISVGASAYAVAVDNGFVGTEVEWLASLVGADGQDGSDGQDGDVGPVGQQGPQGIPGDQGEVGPQGPNGADGDDGIQGIQGVPGNDGQEGPQGEPGIDGQDGAQGETGSQGPPGNNGAQGIQGIQGPAGTDGNDGAQGIQGNAGQQGIQGPPGADSTVPGPQGIPGPSVGTSAFGYAAGAGGTVTQATNKSTAVTLNKLCGQITMHNAALAAGAIVSFTVNNSTVLANDLIVANHALTGTFGPYLITARATANGTAVITVRNTSAGSLGEAIQIRFAVVRGVVA